MSTTDDFTPDDLHLGNDLLDALRAKLVGDDMAAAMLAIPHLKRDPITAGSALLALLTIAVASLADHCRETPTQAVDRLFSKPDGAR